jgi:hypothetical protein
MRASTNRPPDALVDALEVCLQALQTGVDLESCLGLYPQLGELRPLLESAVLARGLAVETVPR